MGGNTAPEIQTSSNGLRIVDNLKHEYKPDGVWDMEILVDRPESAAKRRRKKTKADLPKSVADRTGRLTPVPLETAAAQLARAQSCLRTANSEAIRSLDCEFTGGAIEIRGTVPSYYQKQIAQELIRLHLPAIRIINRVQVSS